MPLVTASRVWSRAEEGERILCTRPVSEGRQEREVLQVEEASKVLPGGGRAARSQTPAVGGSLSVRGHLVVGAEP